MEKILIIGGSGFIGNALYRELHPYFNTYGTFCRPRPDLEENKKFFHFDLEREPIDILLENLRPSLIISAVRGNFEAQVHMHMEVIAYVNRHPKAKLIFLSSTNVFDAFTNFPSYEYDKTLSLSPYGRFKIKIENAVMRLPLQKYVVARLPMVFGAKSPRIQELKSQLKAGEPIEVFSNVVVNATSDSALTQQIHYMINRKKHGIFHLGSKDLIHHNDLIKDFCELFGYPEPLLKNVYDSNFDRFLAALPKDNLLPENLQFSIQEVIETSILQ